ncbi:GyrB-like ATPase domain protein [Nile crocodilepox virus]|uniref:GyrB-like ATPase domain protein n=1 Tax=Nile crocodilepox virus (isolate Crocodylus niloticus/Zimbabwe/Ume/2001) TaxID=1289473 RepID=Q070G4_CPRVZ|nr:GyrB-like ATPase domain protein [Nile crocodilepox virus]ABJ08978.1 GyrB-like ATPase domain protein [Nile crocodilepox virus]
MANLEYGDVCVNECLHNVYSYMGPVELEEYVSVFGDKFVCHGGARRLFDEAMANAMDHCILNLTNRNLCKKAIYIELDGMTVSITNPSSMPVRGKVGRTDCVVPWHMISRPRCAGRSVGCVAGCYGIGLKLIRLFSREMCVEVCDGTDGYVYNSETDSWGSGSIVQPFVNPVAGDRFFKLRFSITGSLFNLHDSVMGKNFERYVRSRVEECVFYLVSNFICVPIYINGVEVNPGFPDPLASCFNLFFTYEYMSSTSKNVTGEATVYAISADSETTFPSGGIVNGARVDRLGLKAEVYRRMLEICPQLGAKGVRLFFTISCENVTFTSSQKREMSGAFYLENPFTAENLKRLCQPPAPTALIPLSHAFSRNFVRSCLHTVLDASFFAYMVYGNPTMEDCCKLIATMLTYRHAVSRFFR